MLAVFAFDKLRVRRDLKLAAQVIHLRDVVSEGGMHLLDLVFLIVDVGLQSMLFSSEAMDELVQALVLLNEHLNVLCYCR